MSADFGTFDVLAEPNGPGPCVRRTFASLLALIVVSCPASASAQDVRYSLLFGVGHASWSGPYVQGGKLSPTLGAGAIEWRTPGPIAMRLELGSGEYSAALDDTDFFSETTTLSFNRAHAAILGRLYPFQRAGRSRPFLELGVARWLRMACDVDLVGGPGLLGGQTVDCDEWEPDVLSDARPLRPSASGSTALLGVGGYLGSLGLTLRYEAGGRPVLDTDEGAMRARALVLAAEWVFNMDAEP